MVSTLSSVHSVLSSSPNHLLNCKDFCFKKQTRKRDRGSKKVRKREGGVEGERERERRDKESDKERGG